MANEGAVLSSEEPVVVTPGAPGTAGTQEPGQEPGSGQAAPEGSAPEAGGEQSPTEGGTSGQEGRRGWSKVDEIRELRAWRREARQRETAYQSELQQMRQQLEELRQLQQPASGRTARNPAEFWQDPQGALQRDLDERLGSLEERLLSSLYQSREQEQFQARLAQEQESAVEFIRSQANYSPEDDEDLIDIIMSIPEQTRATASPGMIAEYAWMKLNQERGVGNKSLARARASSLVGQPPGVGLGQKVWSKAEFDRAVDALERQGVKADQKMLDELYAAAKEGRVK